MPRFGIVLVLCLGLVSAGAQTEKKRKKPVIGRIEWLLLTDLQTWFEARVDTGAKTCSIHAINEKEVKINGEAFIEFDTFDKDEKMVRLRSRLVQKKRVRGTTGELSTRYFIREKIQVGSVTKTLLINLNDRKMLKYNFLIGRNFLRGSFLVDVSLSHTWELPHEN